MALIILRNAIIYWQRHSAAVEQHPVPLTRSMKYQTIETNQLLYPNPASDFVYVGFNSTMEGTANVQLLNSTGQLTKQVAIKVIKGYNQVKIAINDIKEGMYLLRINKGELSIIRKFVIAR